MKTIKVFLSSFIFVISTIIFYQDMSIAVNYICVDPGHGGEQPGSQGNNFGTLEKNANLLVGLALKDSLEISGYPDSVINVIMTRTKDTTLSLLNRASIAMGKNPDSTRANQFIVIHHNGSTNDTINYIMTYWCSYVYEIPNDTIDRNTISDLANRIQAKMTETLKYRQASERLKDSCLTVLENTSMISAYPEVSFITCRKIDSLFYYDSNYPKKEASGIYRGWYEHIKYDPVIVIRNSFGEGEVYVDGYWYESPFHGFWAPQETHTIGAADSFLGYCGYYFCGWSDWWGQVHSITVGLVNEVYTAYFQYDSTYSCYYVYIDKPTANSAFGTGDRIEISGRADPGLGIWGTFIDIFLSRDGGISFPETLVRYYRTSPNINWSFYWNATAPASNQCRLKVVAYDEWCDTTSVISNVFTIYTQSITVLYPNEGEIFCGNTSQIILWSSQNFTGNVKIEYSTNGGTNWNVIEANTVNDGSHLWTVPNLSSDSCRIKISDAADGNPTDMSDTNFSINTIPAPPSNLTWDHCGLTGDINLYWQDNSNNETHFNVYRNDSFLHSTSHSPYTDYYLIPGQSYTYQVKAANGDCESGPSNQVVAVPDSSPVITYGPDLGSNCIIDGNTYTVTVTAHDPGGSPLTYHWECSDGYFSNGLQSIVTSTNWTTYTASLTYSSALAKNLNSTLKPDCYVKVTVKDNGCDYVFKRKSFAIVQDESECCSSCPYLFSWDGYEFVKGNNLLAKSEDSSFFKCNIWDIYHLHQPLISESDFYPLRIEEFENEHSFIDYLGLVSIDYPADRKFGVASDGKFYFYSNPCLPLSCIDNLGQDCLAKIIQEDTIYFESKNKGYLVLNFGSLKTAQGLGKAMVEGGGGGTVPDPPKEPCNYTKPVPASVKSQGNILTVEVFSDNNWIPVTKVYPRARPGKTLVEFSPYIKSEQELKVKLSWEKRYKANQLAYYDFDTTGFVIDRIPLSSAYHSIEGEVTLKLTSDDNNFAELKPGEWIDLFFPYKPLSPDKRRGFALIAKGYYLSQDIEFSSSGNIVSTPEDFSVSQNYPNPFNPQTEIKFSLPQNSKVKLEIFNVLGQKVKTLIDQDMPAGNHIVVWDGKNDCGKEVASGIYFYWIKAGSFTKSAKMSLLK